MKREAPRSEDAGRPGKRARSPTGGQPATGRIVNWYPQKGYGFIQSSICPKDVFFPKMALPPDLKEVEFERMKGLEVSFTFTELDGKPRAEAIYMRGSAPVFDRPPPPRELREMHPGDRHEERPPIHKGTLRSYDAKKGFGFILPDDLREDIFYLRSELPPELDGIEPRRDQVVDRRVDFEVKTMNNGKLRAQRLRFLTGPGGPGGGPGPHRGVIPAGGGMPRRDVHAAPHAHGPGGRNSLSQGRIRSFYPSKGYGFIEAAGQADLFFLPSSLPQEMLDSKQPLEGLEITFEPYTNEEGKPRARNIQPARMLPPPPRVSAPVHTRAPPAQHMVPMTMPPPLLPGPPPPIPMAPPVPHRPPAEPRVMVGTVHAYDIGKGFGFMRADGIAGDVFFARAELPIELREEEKDQVMGKHMEFELKTMPDGKLRAKKLLALRRIGGHPRARGRVIKYHQDKGYGFIDCGWADNVFFMRSSLPKDLNNASLEELQQFEVSFEVSSKEPGKPRASNLEILGREKVAEVNAPRNSFQGGEILDGEIVNFDPLKGFGFIRVRDHNEDVYFVKPELPSELASAERKEEVIGERVEFEVLVKPDGKIRAQDMRLLGSAGKDEPESDLDDDLVQEMEDFLVEHGNRQNYGNFTNRFPRVKKTKIQKHFHITDGDGRQFVELPPDHPRRIEEAAQRPEDEDMREEPKEEPKEEPREDARENEDYLDDFPEPLEEAREVNEEDVDPNEPAIPLGKGLHPLGVIRDYDAKKGYGFIRCKGLAEDVFFPRKALPTSFQGQSTRDMPELKGVQVSFEYNPSGGRGPRSDSVQLLLRWLATDRCWLLKRAQIPPKETKP